MNWKLATFMKLSDSDILIISQLDVSNTMSQNHLVPQVISRKVSPKRDIQRVSIKHYMNGNMFAMNQINQIGILIFKGRVPQPLVFPKSGLFPILYLKRHPFKKFLFYWHKPWPKLWITRFFLNLSEGFRFKVFIPDCCQMSSSLVSFNNHLFKKHLFWTFKSKTPNPPCSFGLHSISHLDNLYFFLWPSPCQKNLDL